MTETNATGSPAPYVPWVWAERTGPRRYTGHNSTGATVQMGPEGTGNAFTPGELLGIALAGCGGMSADTALARRLGDAVGVRVDIERTKHASEDRYESLAERLAVDLSALSPEEREQLRVVVTRAIDKACTVGNTLKASAAIGLTVG